MGQGAPSTLTSEPWRKIVGWDKKEELKQEIRSLSPKIDGDIEVPYYKIILVGLRGAGKSSFFNSINSVFTDRVVTTGETAGSRAKSMTSNYFEHRIYEGALQLKFIICDTMGLLPYPQNKIDVDNIIASMDGHVPHNHEFEDGVRFGTGSSGYIENPTIADMAHCIAIVLNVTTLYRVRDEVLENLRYLLDASNKRKIPVFIVLTHVDEVCEEAKKDAKETYRSIAVEDAVKMVSTKLYGTPEAQIFPIINYKNQTELENNMDVLLLYALRQMLYAAQANLNNRPDVPKSRECLVHQTAEAPNCFNCCFCRH